MAWGRGYLRHLIAPAKENNLPQNVGTNNGPYTSGVSLPTESGGNLIFTHEAGMAYNDELYPMLAPPMPPVTNNMPPQLIDGSAQRAHPNVLNLYPVTPIGTGVPHSRDMIACAGAGAVFDAMAWAQGLGQVANQIGLVYAAANIEGSGAVQGAGVTQIPFMLPSEFAMSYVSTDGPPNTIPNPSGLPFASIEPSDLVGEFS